MGSTSQNVLVVVAICFIVITAATIISVVLVSEKKSKPVEVTPITTEDWFSTTASEEPGSSAEPYACGPNLPCQVVGQDESKEGTTTEFVIPSWLCFPPPGAPDGQEIGDGICHAWANRPECNYDGGDCVAADISNCKPPIHILIAWIGDDICDVDLNNPDCDHDGGDCDNWTPSTIPPDTSTLPPNCDPPYDAMLLWIGDDVCDEVLDTPECEFDGGDCGGGTTQTPITLATTEESSCVIPPNIPSEWLGDGYHCDEALNTPECQFDGGDCNSGFSSTTTTNYVINNCNPPVHILIEWIGDGICDQELNNPDCGNDGGDCDPWTPTPPQPDICSPPYDVMLLWIGDNVCDEVLNTPECQFDGGDCGVTEAPITSSTTEASSCVFPPNIAPSWLGDGTCDWDLFNFMCNWDGGDCDGATTPATYSSTTTQSTAPPIPLGCIIPPGTPIHYLGDKFCDSMLNTEACEFDMGDCSTGASSPPLLVTSTPTTVPEGCILPVNVPPFWLGDNYCDPALNNEACEYDMGDCEGLPTLSTTELPCNVPWFLAEKLGDGECDDVFNYPACNFDSGDCDEGITETTTSTSTPPTPFSVAIPPGCIIPPEIPIYYFGDNYCDPLLNTEVCLYDNGDCELPGSTTTASPIPPGCIIPPFIPFHYLGDDYCDTMLNTEACEYDMGDCDSALVTPVALLTTEASSCVFPPSMPPNWLGDGYCDSALNNTMCNWDNGDCIEVSTEPTEPTTTTISVVIPLGCIIPQEIPIYYLGDNYCDAMLNTEACEFDMGDCGVLLVTTTPSTVPEGCILPAGVPSFWLGDNYCDDVLNNAECFFDFGDCQVDDNDESICNVEWSMDGSLGDGNCDPALNIAECNFDEGDCTDLYIPEGCVLPETVPASWLGDDYCDTILDNAECEYDLGDCEGALELCVTNFTQWVGDGHCDVDLNTMECGFDGGDCYPQEGCVIPEGIDEQSLGDGNCNDELNTPECTNDAGDCLHSWEVIEPSDTIPEGCEIPNYIPVEYLGDAYCDPVLNTIECQYDMGDCEEPEIPANLTFCIHPDLVNNGECNIETENSELCDNDGTDCQEPIPGECQTPDLIGDGVCHFNLLDESCSYDGWDCCQTDYPDWIGDGICDSIHNNAECNFDGTDCASYAIIDDSALAETCKPEHDYMLNWIGDTICDVVLNTEECDFDGGDCNGESPDYPVYLG